MVISDNSRPPIEEGSDWESNDVKDSKARDAPKARLHPNKLSFQSCGEEYELSNLKLEETPFGKGGTNLVFKGILTSKEKKPISVAVKQIKCLNDSLFNTATEEARTSKNLSDLLSSLKDCNLARYLGFCYDGAKQIFHLIFEFIEGTPLSEKIGNLKIGVEVKEKWLYQLATALFVLHSNQIFHSDLTDLPDAIIKSLKHPCTIPSRASKLNINAIIDHTDSLYLIDFGDSKHVITKEQICGHFELDLQCFLHILRQLFPENSSSEKIQNVISYANEKLSDIAKESVSKILHGFGQIRAFLVPQMLDLNLPKNIQTALETVIQDSGVCSFKADMQTRRKIHLYCEYYRAKNPTVPLKHESRGEGDNRELKVWVEGNNNDSSHSNNNSNSNSNTNTAAAASSTVPPASSSTLIPSPIADSKQDILPTVPSQSGKGMTFMTPDGVFDEVSSEENPKTTTKTKKSRTSSSSVLTDSASNILTVSNTHSTSIFSQTSHKNSLRQGSPTDEQS